MCVSGWASDPSLCLCRVAMVQLGHPPLHSKQGWGITDSPTLTENNRFLEGKWKVLAQSHEQLLVELVTGPRPVTGVTLLSHQPTSTSQRSKGTPTFILGMILLECQPIPDWPGRLKGARMHCPHFLPRTSLKILGSLIDSNRTPRRYPPLPLSSIFPTLKPPSP